MEVSEVTDSAQSLHSARLSGLDRRCSCHFTDCENIPDQHRGNISVPDSCDSKHFFVLSVTHCMHCFCPQNDMQLIKH